MTIPSETRYLGLLKFIFRRIASLIEYIELFLILKMLLVFQATRRPLTRCAWETSFSLPSIFLDVLRKCLNPRGTQSIVHNIKDPHLKFSTLCCVTRPREIFFELLKEATGLRCDNHFVFIPAAELLLSMSFPLVSSRCAFQYTVPRCLFTSFTFSVTSHKWST